MNNKHARLSTVLWGFTGLFAVLTGAFAFQWWGKPAPVEPAPAVDPAFTNVATVRVSAGDLIKSGGDASGLDCYACHDKAKPPSLQFDAKNNIVLPKEHQDLVMRHGRNGRNENCFNCHDQNNLDRLKTRDGHILKWEESTQLCASCHGPTYRDWEAGIHGRTSGEWNPKSSARTRQQCASCHSPHNPEFPSMNPAPPPRPLRSNSGTSHH